MKNMDMDEIYRTMGREKIPWNMEQPPEVLVDLVESGRVKPCRTLRKLFERYFEIRELRTVEVRGKYAPHLAVCSFMTMKK